MYGVDDGEAFTAHVEPGEGAALVEWLDRMRFMMRVEVADVTAELAVTWRPADADLVADAAGESAAVDDSIDLGRVRVHPARQLETYAEAAGPACGTWAFEALRIAAGEPRLGLDTDHRTIPNEVGLDRLSRAPRQGLLPRPGDGGAGPHAGPPASPADHAAPRRSDNRLPTRGCRPDDGDKTVGFVGTSARHHELGPIALAMVKRNVPVAATLWPTVTAAQEIVVDPEVGLHVRPLR